MTNVLDRLQAELLVATRAKDRTAVAALRIALAPAVAAPLGGTSASPVGAGSLTTRAAWRHSAEAEPGPSAGTVAAWHRRRSTTPSHCCANSTRTSAGSSGPSPDRPVTPAARP